MTKNAVYSHSVLPASLLLTAGLAFAWPAVAQPADAGQQPNPAHDAQTQYRTVPNPAAVPLPPSAKPPVSAGAGKPAPAPATPLEVSEEPFGTGNARPSGESEFPDGESDPAAAPVPTPKGKKAAAAKTSPYGTQFENDFKEVEPLNPGQIREFNRREDEISKAKVDRKNPSAMSVSVPIAMWAGQTPKTIKLSDGYVSVISFHDMAGQPWPILSDTIGDKEMIAVELPDKPGNLLMVEPKQPYARTNIVIVLQDSTTPITLTLETSRDASYYNADVQVQQRGPNTPVATGPRLPGPIDDDKIRSILDGAGGSMAGVRQVQISGGPADAYFVDDKFYLRTSLTVLSPAYKSIVQGANLSVYELPVTPVIEASDADGRYYELHPSDATLIDGAVTGHVPYDPMHPYDAKPLGIQ